MPRSKLIDLLSPLIPEPKYPSDQIFIPEPDHVRYTADMFLAQITADLYPQTQDEILCLLLAFGHTINTYEKSQLAYYRKMVEEMQNIGYQPLTIKKEDIRG